jgi:hypothetical protein
MIVVFSAMSLFFAREFYFSLQVKHWRKTTAIIEYSYVSSGGRGGDKLKISYTYAVAGNIFQNDRVNFGLPSINGHLSNAQDALNYYPEGKMVNVYYQESSPDNSVLEPKPNLRDNFYRLFILIFTVCILTYYRFFKLQRLKRSQ